MNVYVVVCHPSPDSFTAAAFRQVVESLGDHNVRISDLYADDFRPELSAAEHAAHLTATAGAGRPDIEPYVANLQWCEALVLVYPTWWSGQPAMLKGWFDRVLVNGVAWSLPHGAKRIRPMLGNIRRIVVVTSHGSSKLINSLQGEGGKRVVTRTLRSLCHPLTRTKWIALYGIDRCTDQQRQQFLSEIGRQMRRL